ncbi:MAG: FMN-binding negative transcriptional regulator [Bdellovibrionales bacterium]
MYLPKRFENENFDESYDLIQKNSLANLISTTEHGPFVSHIPLVLEKMMCQPGTVL